MIKKGLLFILFFGVQQVMAQFPCVDSNRIDPFFQCNDPRFEPVCGCNFVTYRNECVSFRNHGVNIIFSDGVCQNDVFFFDLYPNLVTSQTELFIQFYDQGPVTIEIRDAFGRLSFFRIQNQVTFYRETLNLTSYKTGVYFLSVRSGSQIKFKRIIKVRS